MTQSLHSVMAKLAALPEEEQERIAKWLSAELAADERWSGMFAESEGMLADMADDALADLDTGKTIDLDPDRM
jgi:hypothetical protein